MVSAFPLCKFSIFITLLRMADRATKSGIAAEAFDKIQGKYDPDLASQILRWVTQITGESLNTDGSINNFISIFQDGILLCK